MSTSRPPPGTIPTLTEVVAWPESSAAEEEVVSPPPPAVAAPVAAPVAAAAPEPAPVPAPPATASVAVPQPAVSAKAPAATSHADVQLTQRVLADLQRQVELMLEVRLREALAPILARASDALVRDARKELTAAMRDIVSRSLARELGKREER
ncbi:MAG: hypothetical protein ABIZ18_13805 [Caldimonas sp.]